MNRGDPTGLICGTGACVGAGWGIGVGIGMVSTWWAAKNAGSIDWSDSQTNNSPQKCDDDDCQPLYDEIDQLVKVLKKRYWEMREDKHDLFNTKPTGRNSWDGHQQQYKQVQVTLRRVLSEAETKGCMGYRSDAWKWATKPPPIRPAPL